MAQEQDEKQTKKMRDAFNLFDQDGNGSIDIQELGKALSCCGQDLTTKELKAIMDAVDTNGNKKIDFDEFCQMMANHYKSDAEKVCEIKHAFALFDKNKNGTIDREELKFVMKSFTDEALTEEDIDEVLKEADTSGDGVIDIDEFTNLILQMDDEEECD